MKPDLFPSYVKGHTIRWPMDRSLEQDLGCWRVAYTKPRNEKALARDCQRMGVAYFLPLYEKRSRRRDNNKPRKSIVPLFSSYLPFVDRDEGKYKLCETGRLVHVLPVLDQEGFVRDMAQVWQAVTSGAPLDLVQTIAVGQKLRIRTGPMEGAVGVVRQVRGRYRLLLNVEMFQMAVSVELDRSDVEVERSERMAPGDSSLGIR